MSINQSLNLNDSVNMSNDITSDHVKESSAVLASASKRKCIQSSILKSKSNYLTNDENCCRAEHSNLIFGASKNVNCSSLLHDSSGFNDQSRSELFAYGSNSNSLCGLQSSSSSSYQSSSFSFNKSNSNSANLNYNYTNNRCGNKVNEISFKSDSLSNYDTSNQLKEICLNNADASKNFGSSQHNQQSTRTNSVACVNSNNSLIKSPIKCSSPQQNSSADLLAQKLNSLNICERIKETSILKSLINSEPSILLQLNEKLKQQNLTIASLESSSVCLSAVSSAHSPCSSSSSILLLTSSNNPNNESSKNTDSDNSNLSLIIHSDEDENAIGARRSRRDPKRKVAADINSEHNETFYVYDDSDDSDRSTQEDLPSGWSFDWTPDGRKYFISNHLK
jgi:hypothetical protein